MQRKYIYIIVVCLTVVLVTATQYIDSNNKRKTNSDYAHYLEEEHDDSFNKTEILSQLVIKNVQNDDKHIPYTYRIIIEDIAGAYKYEYNGEEKYLVFDAKGEAQILLNSNESITLYDLPDDSSYSIEQTNNVKESYTTTVNEESGTIIKGKISSNNKIVFENKTIIKPIEEEPEEKKNPITTDNISKFIVLSLFLLVITISLSKIQIIRFE